MSKKSIFGEKFRFRFEKVDSWSKMSKKLIFGEKFRFWSKKSIFRQKCRKCRFLVKNLDFGRKVDFWSKISILVEKVDFWSKMSEKSIFGKKNLSLTKKTTF